eukprot:11171874-Lingulodinium_polyedra.AAC.1
MISKGRAAAAELEADTDGARFRAEVVVLKWRLDAARMVMNTEGKGLGQLGGPVDGTEAAAEQAAALWLNSGLNSGFLCQRWRQQPKRRPARRLSI